MGNYILKIFLVSEISFSKDYLNCYQINTVTTEVFIFGLARLTQISNPSTDSETLSKVRRDSKFLQETKQKHKYFADSEKEVTLQLRSP